MLDVAREPLAHKEDPARGWTAFSKYAWFVLAYLLFVVLFGAWVRITGSGAGCGSHWPTCHGEVLPPSLETKTLIEFTHRATSGLLGFLVLGLVAGAFLLPPVEGRRKVVAAVLVTLAFTIVEAAIGARIVLAELVANDASVARALVIVIHLGSTFTLTAATALAAFFATRGAPISFSAAPRGKWLFAGALLAVLVVSMTGAITALGDTLFPVSPTESGSLIARIRTDLDEASHFLVRLRIIHPVLAVTVAGALLALPTYVNTAPGERAGRLLAGVRGLTLLQVGVGVVNIALGAPGWVQLVHLLAAQGVWLSLLLAFAAYLEKPGHTRA